MNKPIAVLITDEHYTPSTLELADAAMNQALRRAESLNVPLISLGDLLDTKSILRAECVNKVINTFKSAKVPIIVLVGNHTLLNEKGKEHALHFLEPYAKIVGTEGFHFYDALYLVAYQSDPQEFRNKLKLMPTGATILCHQGLSSANMGHYNQDKSAVSNSDVKRFRVISGHYHTRQNIGTFTYLGNPYTLSFSEANDPEKGYGILYADGTLELIPTNLRKHIILELDYDKIQTRKEVKPEDPVWVKIKGPRSELAKLNKKQVGDLLNIGQNFKFDKLPTDEIKSVRIEKLNDSEILDSIIDSSGEKSEHKEVLKKLWRSLL